MQAIEIATLTEWLFRDIQHVDNLKERIGR